MSKELPLSGLLVLEFSQFMAGPSAGLKLADLGARVIKIERPGSGEAGRKIAIKNMFIGEDSLVFHTINRNKESYTANLKDPTDLQKVKQLIRHADVMTHNFRPGVMEKLGLAYAAVRNIHPKLIYADVLGYGKEGPWANKPGQDLLIQSVSGLTYLTGNKDDAPTPMGLAASDMFTGGHLVQGILAALIQREKTGIGCQVSVSLLESTLDMQFEALTTYLNAEDQAFKRAVKGSAHPFLGAPYGVYKTKDGYLAIAMMPLVKLATALKVELPSDFKAPSSRFEKRDGIMAFFQKILLGETSQSWQEKLEAQGIWCAEVLDYDRLLNYEGFKVLGMDQKVFTSDGTKIHTTRCPVRMDGERIFSGKSAPKAGEHTRAIEKEFDLV
ncbi:MAG: CoA transferase [Bacteroidota bacterium]